MKTSKHVTITSKNQITIPVDFVRKLNLHQDRTMQATLKDGRVILTPTKDLSDDMKRYWPQRDTKASLTDSELKTATRLAVSKRASK